METIIRSSRLLRLFKKDTKHNRSKVHNLAQGKPGTTYIVKEVMTDDAEMRDFLFTLGCYENEEVTVISKLANNIVINVKDARYSINEELAEVIKV